MNRLLSLLLTSALLNAPLLAAPPEPPAGFRWVLNEQFSDEFNGTQLDRSKWQNQYRGGWKGRSPAWFNPEAVSLQDGTLQIRSGVLDEPKHDGLYTMYGGAVSSTTAEAHFGYYECRAKASRIAMSTTFWMSNDKVPFTENDDCENDTWSQELDIQEAVGGNARFEKFAHGMNCNTHYRYVECDAEKETFISKGTGTKLESPVYADFHIYGAWWKDAHEVSFYANNRLFDTVQFRTDISAQPFSRPMQINMVTETYNWQPPPAPEELENPDINTAYYDWIRSYKLVPIDQKLKQKRTKNIFDDSIAVSAKPSDSLISIEYTYQANQNSVLRFEVVNAAGKVLARKKVGALHGYGHNRIEIEAQGEPAYLTANLQSKKGKRINETAKIDL